jgi:hypothetical protein
MGDPSLPGVPAYAPSPRHAHHRRPRAGAEMTPTVTSPASSSASSVAHTGMPRTKFFVPSIGSTIQRRSPTTLTAPDPPPARSPNSSPSTASPGRREANSARSASSTARSASVTGVRSGLVSIARSCRRNAPAVIRSASAQSSNASRRSSAGAPAPGFTRERPGRSCRRSRSPRSRRASTRPGRGPVGRRSRHRG